MNEYLSRKVIDNDLTWLLQTPSFIDDHSLIFKMPQPERIDIEHLRQDYDSLLSQRKGRLGHYVETLVQALFKAHPRFRVITHNQLMRHQERTLGELDLLLYDDDQNSVLHLEIALKYYLLIPGTQPLDKRFIGPGLQDSLHKKLNRLYHHQLKLPHLANDRYQCWPKALPFPDVHQAWILGRLYLPSHRKQQELIHGPISGTPWHFRRHCPHSIWQHYTKNSIATPISLSKTDALYGDKTSDAPNRLPGHYQTSAHPLPIFQVPQSWLIQAQQAVHQYCLTLT